MTSCQGCGQEVLPEFGRVFGDENDNVSCCPNCETISNIQRGAAAVDVMPERMVWR